MKIVKLVSFLICPLMMACCSGNKTTSTKDQYGRCIESALLVEIVLNSEISKETNSNCILQGSSMRRSANLYEEVLNFYCPSASAESLLKVKSGLAESVTSKWSQRRQILIGEAGEKIIDVVKVNLNLKTIEVSYKIKLN